MNAAKKMLRHGHRTDGRDALAAHGDQWCQKPQYFLSALHYKFLFNYPQLWQSYVILSATSQCVLRPMVDTLSMWCELGNWQSVSPLIRSEACVSYWIEMKLFSINLIQLNSKPREAVVHVRVWWQWPCNHTQLHSNASILQFHTQTPLFIIIISV